MMFRSEEEFLKALRDTDPKVKLPIEWSDISFILRRGGLNTLLCDEASMRTCFTSNLVQIFLEKNGVVSYIDLDTMFTVSFESEAKRFPNVENLLLAQPDKESMDSVIAEVCSLTSPRIELIIFDSISTFYHLYGEDVDYGDLNRKLGAYLTLLKKLTERSNAYLVATSLLRAKKTRSGLPWIQGYSGGRVLKARSDLILALPKGYGRFELKLVKHHVKELEGRVLTLSFHLKHVEPYHDRDE